MRNALTICLGVTAAAVLLAQQQQPPPRYKVDITRVIVDAHVVDDSGAPVRGLTASDFRVRIDGRPARVEHVRFVSAAADAAPAAAARPHSDPATASSASAASDLPPAAQWTESSGRLIVLVFQRSMEQSRLAGLLKMQKRAEDFLGSTAPGDRTAVVWFDSHLKLAADFTADRGRLAAVLQKSTVWATPPQLDPGPFPSLAAVFDNKAALQAGSIEQGLLVLGRALGELPGPKAVVLFGWGLGRQWGVLWRPRVSLDDDYAMAREALVSARASVFSVDVTDAAWHSLEKGLQALSEDTGGAYVRTVDFADAAFDRVARILSAQYELGVVKPDLPRGTHKIEVTVPGRHVTVFARKGYTD